MRILQKSTSEESSKTCSEALELARGVDEIDVTHHDRAAAIALDLHLIKELLFRALRTLLLELVPEVADGLAAAQTADRDNHQPVRITPLF